MIVYEKLSTAYIDKCLHLKEGAAYSKTVCCTIFCTFKQILKASLSLGYLFDLFISCYKCCYALATKFPWPLYIICWHAFGIYIYIFFYSFFFIFIFIFVVC